MPTTQTSPKQEQYQELQYWQGILQQKAQKYLGNLTYKKGQLGQFIVFYLYWQGHQIPPDVQKLADPQMGWGYTTGPDGRMIYEGILILRPQGPVRLSKYRRSA